MIFHLNKDERKLLQDFNIDFRSDFDYSDEEAFALLDQVHDAEIFYLEISSKQKKGGRSVDIGIIIALVSLIVEIIDLIVNYKDNHKD